MCFILFILTTMMKFFVWAKKHMHHYSLFDYAVFKITLFVAGLLVAKLWPEILSLDWEWYLIVFVAGYIWLWYRLLIK